ncbi:hypothetical protein [Prolixibacter sp. SD074]|uniref:hypothetical protein n=1 Tax=Prolixibacter sp. SD074 TaxID=2652391 RepID=UPI0012892498|nr:hypothetical protein [Prolixibacter sp. SD074]GET30638.1 hypothetical protein SD074_28400 [Prolixibacter sp. SD074]
MENYFDNRRLLQLLLKWKLHLGIIAVVAAVLAAIFTGPAFIHPKFRSTAKVYPMLDVRTFSDESETEQMLEFFKSTDLKRRMVETFDLGEVYRVSKSYPYFWSTVLDRYDKNVDIRKTEYQAVQISVLDEEPLRASDMADSLISFCDSKMLHVYRQRYREYAKTSGMELKNLMAQRDSLVKDLTHYSERTGLLDYPEQVKEAARGYMEAVVKGGVSSPSSREVKKDLERLGQNGIPFWQMSEELEGRNMEIDSLRTYHHWALSQANKEAKFARVVQKPFPADRKYRPKRTLIVLLSVLFALSIGTVVIAFVDRKNS